MTSNLINLYIEYYNQCQINKKNEIVNDVRYREFGSLNNYNIALEFYKMIIKNLEGKCNDKKIYIVYGYNINGNSVNIMSIRDNSYLHNYHIDFDYFLKTFINICDDDVYMDAVRNYRQIIMTNEMYEKIKYDMKLNNNHGL